MHHRPRWRPSIKNMLSSHQQKLPTARLKSDHQRWRGALTLLLWRHRAHFVWKQLASLPRTPLGWSLHSAAHFTLATDGRGNGGLDKEGRLGKLIYSLKQKYLWYLNWCPRHANDKKSNDIPPKTFTKSVMAITLTGRRFGLRTVPGA